MLFPDPVGATERTSRPSSIASTTSPCPGRNAWRPNTSRRTRSASATIQGSLTEFKSQANALYEGPSFDRPDIELGDGQSRAAGSLCLHGLGVGSDQGGGPRRQNPPRHSARLGVARPPELLSAHRARLRPLGSSNR